MNNFLHPDTFYEDNRQYQQERLEESQRIRPFLIPKSSQSNLKDQLLLLSGDLFITFGTNLKSRARQQLCKPQAA
jgi:hypothetical protein